VTGVQEKRTNPKQKEDSAELMKFILPASVAQDRYNYE